MGGPSRRIRACQSEVMESLSRFAYFQATAVVVESSRVIVSFSNLRRFRNRIIISAPETGWWTINSLKATAGVRVAATHGRVSPT